jgi:hypothetical protein
MCHCTRTTHTSYFSRVPRPNLISKHTRCTVRTKSLRFYHISSSDLVTLALVARFSAPTAEVSEWTRYRFFQMKFITFHSRAQILSGVTFADPLTCQQNFFRRSCAVSQPKSNTCYLLFSRTNRRHVLVRRTFCRTIGGQSCKNKITIMLIIWFIRQRFNWSVYYVLHENRIQFYKHVIQFKRSHNLWY